MAGRSRGRALRALQAAGLGLALAALGLAGLGSIGATADPPALVPPPPAPPQDPWSTWLLVLDAPVEALARDPRPSDLARARPARYRALEAAGRAAVARIEGELARMAAAGLVEAIEPFPALGVVALRAEPASLSRLARLPGLRALRANRWHRLSAATEFAAVGGRPRPAQLPRAQAATSLGPAPEAWHLTASRAEAAWSGYGTAGEGAVVALLDTGADAQHPLLAARYRGRDARDQGLHWLDATSAPGASRPIDPHGHGSHVTGLAVGRQAGLARGTAPGAEWIAARVFDAGGRASDLWLLRGASWSLAPVGADGRPRPDLAPDVVNGSWSLENGADPLLDRFVATWLALDIVPVFAAGNIEDGADLWGRVLAPAGHPGVLAVGASTREGRPWGLSRSGPGFHDRVKPDLVAPGVGLISARPGGGLAERSGSSMASPQVAGAAALLRSLAPELSASEVQDLLRDSAAGRSASGPDGQLGWGRLDVAAAAEAAAETGRVVGRLGGVEGRAGAGAEILARSAADAPIWRRRAVGADGRFRLALPAGRWLLETRALEGEATPRWIELRARQTLTVDLSLRARAPAASADLSGRLVDADGRAVAGARLGVADLPGRVAADADGRFALRLPPGRAELRVEAAGRRAVTRALELAPGAAPPLELVLPRAPRLLLVDADAWDGERVAPYLERALRDAGFEPELRAIDDLALLPTIAELAEQEILIWLQVYGSPGLIDQRRSERGLPPAAVPALEAFVARGGRLILSGQDITLHDLQRGLAPGYLERLFGAGLERARPWNAPTRVRGEGVFEGLSLDLAWPRGAPKLRYFEPDVLSPLGSGESRVLLRYADGGPAALLGPDAERPAMLFGFGLESAGGRADLAALLGRALRWLQAPELSILVDEPAPREGQVIRLRPRLRTAAAAASASLRIQLPPALETVDPGALRPEGDGGLVWSGHLTPETELELPLRLRLAPALPAGSAAEIRLRLEAAGRVLSRTVELAPDLPDLRPSRLGLRPDRVPTARAVALELELRNAVAVTARALGVDLRLPGGLEALTPSLQLSSGRADWSPGGLRWEPGDLGPGAPARLTFDLQPRAGLELAEVLARIEDGAGRVITRQAALRLGGPLLEIRAAELRPAALAAGEVATLALRLGNAGRAAPEARLQLSLPVGLEPHPAAADSPEGAWLAWRGPLPAGAETELRLPLRARIEAEAGPRQLTLQLDDGLLPPALVTRSLSLDLLRPELSASRAVLLPQRARAGGLLSLTLLVANHGGAAARLLVTDTYAPSLTPLGETIEASRGLLRPEPGVLGWSLDLPAAIGEPRAQPAPPGAAPPEPGDRLPAPGPEGWVGPVDLGLAFPFYREVYTRAWIAPDGWLAFTEPRRPERPSLGEGGPEVAAVAVLWRRSAPPMAPGLRREGHRSVVDWSSAGRVLASLSLAPDGAMQLRYAPGQAPGSALVGLRSPDAETWLLGPDELSERGADLAPAGRWAWLRYRSRIGTASEPNRWLGHTVEIATAGQRITLSPQVRVNALSLAGSRLTVDPPRALAGSGLRYGLALVAEGELGPRELVARVGLPSAARLDPSSLSPGLRYDPEARELSWRGALAAGARQDLAWRMRLAPALRDGGRAVATLRISSAGLPELHLRQDLPLRATSLALASKTVARPVAPPGVAQRFVLQLTNAGGAALPLDLLDELPAELELIEGSPRASSGPPPRWDAASRHLRWTGTLPAAGALQLELEARLRGAEPGLNLMRLREPGGYELLDWAELKPLRARRYLPLLGAPGARRGS